MIYMVCIVFRTDSAINKPQNNNIKTHGSSSSSSTSSSGSRDIPVPPIPTTSPAKDIAHHSKGWADNEEIT
jgi:hypothetical protein